MKGKLKTTTGIADLRTEVNGKEGKARTLSKFFAKVFTTEPECKSTHTPVLNDIKPFQALITSKEDVMTHFQKLKTYKSFGPYSIQPRILRGLKEELCEVLADIYNDIYNASPVEGRLPADWKTDNVSAVYKEGEKSEASNYQPVSLTSVVCSHGNRTAKAFNEICVRKWYSIHETVWIRSVRSTTFQMLHVMDE